MYTLYLIKMSLEGRCYNKIHETLYNTPPLIQEKILSTTNKYIEDKIRNELLQSFEQKLPAMVSTMIYEIDRLNGGNAHNFKSNDHNDDIVMKRIATSIARCVYREAMDMTTIKYRRDYNSDRNSMSDDGNESYDSNNESDNGTGEIDYM